MTSFAELDEDLTQSSQQIGLDRPYDLGILLVHGLGEQARGDTLTVQGDPLVAWLRGRVGGTGRPGDPKVDVVNAASRQQSTDSIPSAHAVIRFTPATTPGKPAPEPNYWVIAEAFWAENFRQATFGESIRWVLTVGPWVFATQVAAMWRRMEIGRHVPRWLRVGLIPITIVVGVAFLFLAAVAGFLVTVAAVAVFVFAQTNIPFLGDLARGIQSQLANGLGDAQVLSRSPVRFSAMAAEVRTGLRVLREQCRAVVLVAESQGTAVAWYGLKHEIMGGLARSPRPEPGHDPEPGQKPKPAKELAPIGLFLTHGQAIRKLTFALHMARGGQTAAQARAALLSAAFVGLGVAAFLLQAVPLGVASLGLAFIAEARLGLLAKPVWEASGADIAKDWEAVQTADAKTRPPESGKLEWLDLWASADPAPVGPLDVKGIPSYKIRNRGSTIGDHVAYWQSTTEFLPILASYLFALGGPDTYGVPLHDPRLQVPALRRHARVMALLPFRLFVALGVVAGAIYVGRTPSFGADLVDFVASLDVPIVSPFFASASQWVETATGLAVVLVAGVVTWLVVSGAWNGLMTADERTFFGGVSRHLWSWPWPLFIAALVPIAAAVAWLLWREGHPDLGAGYLLAASAVSLLCLTVLSGGGKTYGTWERQEKATVATTRITGRRWSSRAIVLIVAALIVVVPAVTAGVRIDALPAVIAVETILLSIVLALEGIREYRLFSRRFRRLNSRLPRDERSPRPEAGPSSARRSSRPPAAG